ncbi:AI-2E family transporter [Skermanella pratensis]|uniref:AI-2E family transporter n=1 Tax=Skermanella pratensis TaxID=2233999 RepID=UPI001FEB935C|nr:AI-2E family transporter [Skermanella pratensis]
MTSNIAAPHLKGRPRATGPMPNHSQGTGGRSGADRVALIGLFSLAVLYTLYLARDLLLPIFLALLLSLLLRPLVKALRRVRVPEVVSAIILVALLLAGLIGAAFSLTEPATSWIKRAPVVMTEMEFKLGDLRDSIESARRASHQIEQMAAAADDEAQAVIVRGPTLAEQLLTQTQVVLAQAFIVLVLLFFFLAGGRSMLEQVMGSMTNLEARIHYATIAGTVQKNIAAYLATVTLINTALGLLTAGIMTVLGMPNPGLWGVMAALLNFIPYLGSAVSLVIIGVVSALTFDDLFQMAAPPLSFLFLTTIEGNFVTPMIVGRRLTLNPIAVFLTILFWGWLWGIPGALMAVPILAVFKILCDAHKPLHPLGALLGGKPGA